MENNQTTEPTSSPVNVSELLKDEGFRKLPLNSEAFANAVKGDKVESASTNVESQGEAEDENGEDQVETEAKGNDESDKKEVPDSVKARFKRITEARDAAEMRAEQLERELARLRAGVKTEASPNAEVKTEAKGDQFVFDKPEPEPKDFKDVASYTKALSRYESEKYFAEQKWQQSKDVEVKTVQERYKNFFEKGKSVEQELGLRDGEFALYVQDPSFQITAPARDALLESEFSARIGYEIASNPTTREQFGKMSDAQQVKFIGKLEAKFETTKSEPQGGNKKTTAKPIGSSIKGSASAPASLKGKPLNSITQTVSSQREFRKVIGMND